MSEYPIGRETILRALQEALEPLPFVHAMWQGGAAAFGRVDEWSDIDLQADADDERGAEVFAAAEAALSALSPIELRYEIPQPTWHGHAQAFYRLRDTSPFLLIDFVVLKHSNPQKFLQREIHGEAAVHFDKSGVVQSPPFDPDAWLERLKGRVAALGQSFPLFQTLTLKELERGNAIEAQSFYMAYTLRPLVELLRITHDPSRFDFHTRYVYYNLPQAAVRRLEPLFFSAGPAELRANQAAAEQWFGELAGELDWAAIAGRLAGEAR